MSQDFALNSALPNGGNPGYQRYRKTALINKDAVWQNAPGAIYSILIRNAATTPVWLNLYDNASPNNVTVGSGSTPPVSRIMCPAAVSASVPAQLIISISPDALDWFGAGLVIAPVTSDSDNVAVGGTLYVEIRYKAMGGP